jgi:hypothetical protein
VTSRAFPVFASLLALAAFVAFAAPTQAEPLSRKTEIDFFRDVPSRNLEGLAARSDGRLVAGPTLTELAGSAPADLFWSLAATNEPHRWVVGTGPDGKIFEVEVDAAKNNYTSRELADLDESHIFSIAQLADGALLVGTSPSGALCLVRDGKQVARVALPVDSIFDILLLPDTTISNSKPKTQNSKPIVASTALIATGNPGRIYRVDLAKFAASPVVAEKIADEHLLAERGISLFGEIRDRNVRRVARLADGRIAAGSAPKGNVYAFAADGGAPVILQENYDAEVTDLLATPDGLYATLTFSGGSGEGRITPTKSDRDLPEPLALMPSAGERFGGRSSLVWLPRSGFPETVATRNGTAFYRLARHDDLLVLTGGEQGEMLGYDIAQRLSLTFAGSSSSQLNGLAPIPNQPGRFVVMRNNAPGFALLDFAATGPREAETRRIDLGSPALLGALRFNRLRDLSESDLALEIKTSNGSDEVEGWTPWTPLAVSDGGWSAAEQRGRYVKLRLSLPATTPPTAQIDKASLYTLPQNRRPQLQDFRLLSANFALLPTPNPTVSPIISVGQLLEGRKDDDPKSRSSLLGNQIVPAPGMQVVMWTVNDPDGDNLVCTFSVRRDGDETWTDIALDTPDSFVQFDLSHLRDGVYFTRLVARETAPRIAADRLVTTFETDDLVVDRTAPEIVNAAIERDAHICRVSVQGSDTLSLLDGVEVIFNNGSREETEQPLDGILDARAETFVIELPLERVANATAVEITLYDAAGNTAVRRLSLPKASK